MNQKLNNLIDFEIEDGVLKKYRGNDKHIIIPDSVTTIGNYAFASEDPVPTNCSNDTLPFRNLESVIIPDSVTSIGDEAFSGCRFLTSVTIGNGITSIGRQAFAGCTSLHNLTIPDSVMLIGYMALPYLLNNLYKWRNGFYIGKHLLYGTDKNGTFVVKPGTRTIAGGAFCAFKNITRVKIPNSVISIGDGAFYQCDESLVEVNIGTGLKIIDAAVFFSCDKLKTIKYAGAEEQWRSVEIREDNYLEGVEIKFCNKS